MHFYLFLSLIICLYLYLNYHISGELISGFWEADSRFCDESNLDMFCLYLGRDRDIFGRRSCYVLATQNNHMIINEPTSASIRPQFCPSNMALSVAAPKYFSINFQHIDEAAETIFPKNQKMIFYPSCGKMVLFHDETITAILYKNPICSEDAAAQSSV